MRQSDSAGAGTAVGGAFLDEAPSLLHGPAHEILVGAVVDDEHDLLERHDIEQLVDLEDAAGIRLRKTAQVHEHRVAFVGEPGKRNLPGVIVTEKLGDAKASVAVGFKVHLRNS